MRTAGNLLVARCGTTGALRFDYDRPRSIGRMKGFYGNVGVVARALAYLLRMGGDGLTRASEDAVLNANYLRARLRETCHVARGGSALDIATTRHPVLRWDPERRVE